MGSIPTGGTRSKVDETEDERIMSASDHNGVSARRRAFALSSLGVGVLLAVVILVFLSRNAQYVIVGLVGLALLGGGGWWVITEQMPRRAVGAVTAVAGLSLIGGGVVAAAWGAEFPVLRLLVVFVLLGATVGFARAALIPELHDHDLERPARVAPPRHPVLICNPWSGGGKVEEFDLVALAEELGIEVVMLDHGLDLEQLARDAIARGADCLGMAGGDGSQALVASIAIEHDLPFVCVTAGTRNHFALDLGLDREDPRGASTRSSTRSNGGSTTPRSATACS